MNECAGREVGNTPPNGAPGATLRTAMVVWSPGSQRRYPRLGPCSRLHSTTNHTKTKPKKCYLCAWEILLPMCLNIHYKAAAALNGFYVCRDSSRGCNIAG